MRDFLSALSLGLRLRCPGCREEPLFPGAFRMHPRCPRCGYLIEREDGYFIGAIYVNYAVTVGICVGGFLALDRYAAPPLWLQLGLWGSVCVAFPVAFFRHSRSLWLNLDHFLSRKLSASGGREAP